MPTVGMHEAKTRLSQLVQEVEAGGDVIIARNGEPVVRLVRIERSRSGRGAMVGRGTVEELTWDDVVEGDREVVELFDQS